MVATIVAEDREKTAAYLSNLTIPEHGVWFVRYFGPEKGQLLDSTYQDLLEQMPDQIVRRLRNSFSDERTNIRITVLRKPVDPSERLARAILDAVIEPITLYSVSMNKSTEKYGTNLGYFIYIDGAFRSVDIDVFQTFIAALTPRIRQGEKVTAGSVVRQTAPRYPNDARAARIQGDVVLHIVIDMHGVVEEVDSVSGDPALVPSAIDAVKQWRYSPTLLNGQPVEIDTIVTIHFRLQ
jgi:TonB family protein